MRRQEGALDDAVVPPPRPRGGAPHRRRRCRTRRTANAATHLPQHADHAMAYGDDMEPKEPKDEFDDLDERDERIKKLYGSAFGEDDGGGQ